MYLACKRKVKFISTKVKEKLLKAHSIPKPNPRNQLEKEKKEIEINLILPTSLFCLQANHTLPNFPNNNLPLLVCYNDSTKMKKITS